MADRLHAAKSLGLGEGRVDQGEEKLVGPEMAKEFLGRCREREGRSGHGGEAADDDENPEDREGVDDPSRRQGLLVGIHQIDESQGRRRICGSAVRVGKPVGAMGDLDGRQCYPDEVKNPDDEATGHPPGLRHR